MENGVYVYIQTDDGSVLVPWRGNMMSTSLEEAVMESFDAWDMLDWLAGLPEFIHLVGPDERRRVVVGQADVVAFAEAVAEAVAPEEGEGESR